MATLTGILVGQGGIVPAGTVIPYGSTSAPYVYIKCNGAAISRTVYADLFAAIGTNFGGGDGSTTFNVPDLRGEFIRGWDDGRGVDSGRSFASFQDHQFQDHNHNAYDHTGGWSYQSHYSGPHTTTHQYDSTRQTSGAVNGNRGSETRPRNIAMLYSIKY
jgi:phage-related tail fiber protein